MIPKFRAWKKVETPEMFNDVRAIDFDKGIVKLGYRLSRDTVRIDKEKLSKMELMQSTGLKDKNGTEIYEGDIVHVLSREVSILTGDSFFQHETKGMITSKLGGFWVGNKPLYLLIQKYDPILTEINILGNIYQHPHLLEADSHE